MEHAEHKRNITAVFDTASEGYDDPALSYFAESARYMVGDMRLTGNERLLDVATGTGHVAVEAARRLKDGSVTGVDISQRMLEKARDKARALGLLNVGFVCRDMEDMGLPDGSFDIASCSFGLFFLPDMENGLRCISRAIRPGGRLYLTSFSSSFMKPLRGMLLDRLNAFGIETVPLKVMRLDTPDEIRGLLLGAGYGDIDIRARQLGRYIKDSREWLDILWKGAYRGVLGRLSGEDLERFTEEHLREVEALRDEKGIWLEVEVLYAEAKR